LMVAAPDFNGGRLPRTPSEIVACPTLRSTESWALWCQRAGVAEPQHGLLINDSNLLLEAVRLGQGIALERRSLVAGALAEGRLVQLGDIRVPYPYPYWLVWPQREPPSDRHQAFADWLREEARRYQAEQPPLSE
ncbi:LysR substrate-binding domain-containing protein, partial [Pseudomonas aeruginosa]